MERKDESNDWREGGRGKKAESRETARLPLALGLVVDEVGGAVGAPADLLHHLVLLHGHLLAVLLRLWQMLAGVAGREGRGELVRMMVAVAGVALVMALLGHALQ
jgi:hypothetical protein